MILIKYEREVSPMNNFLAFLGENMFATVVAVAGLLASVVAIVDVISKRLSKAKVTYILLIVSLIIVLIASAYLFLQYTMLPKGNSSDEMQHGYSENSDSSNRLDDDLHDKEDINDTGTMYNETDDIKQGENGDSEKIPVTPIPAPQYRRGYYNGPYNADTFTLYTDVAAARMITNDTDIRLLGVQPNTAILVEAQLIDFETDDIIDQKSAFLGEEITFSNIPSGTYYYTVSCDGYKNAFPDELFRLEEDVSQPKDELPWSVDLEENNSSPSPYFKIQLKNMQGEILRNTSAYVRAINSQHLSPNEFSACPVTSNDQGYLTLWSNTDGVDYYDVVSFQLFDGYLLEVALENGEYISVDIQGDLGICILHE